MIGRKGVSDDVMTDAQLGARGYVFYSTEDKRYENEEKPASRNVSLIVVILIASALMALHGMCLVQ